MKLLFAIYFVTTILLINKYDIKLKKNDFRLERQAFWDPIRIRYNIPLDCLPTTFVWRDSFNLQHVLFCPKGGLLILDIKSENLTAGILGEVYQKRGYRAVTYTVDGGRVS